jgi:hypothetical protein
MNLKLPSSAIPLAEVALYTSSLNFTKIMPLEELKKVI